MSHNGTNGTNGHPRSWREADIDLPAPLTIDRSGIPASPEVQAAESRATRPASPAPAVPIQPTPQAARPVPPAQDLDDAGDAEPERLVDNVTAHDAAPKVVAETTVRPILPMWAQSREALAREAKRVGMEAAREVAYHGLRAPVYAGRIAWWTLRGAVRTLGSIITWATVDEARTLKGDRVDHKDHDGWRQVADAQARRSRIRVPVALIGTGITLTGGIVLHAMGGIWLESALAGVVASLAYAGCPRDQRLFRARVSKRRHDPITADLTISALRALRIPGLDADALSFTSDICRDGAGWRVELDLTPGVTAAAVMTRREALASGLGRPLGAVWPEGDPSISPRRLVIWVGDEDVSRRAAPPWPWLDQSVDVSVWSPIPMGVTPRGTWVHTPLLYENMLMGGLPGTGKTFSLRPFAAAAALDPNCEMWIAEHKGTADFRSIADAAATRYVVGVDPEHIAETISWADDLIEECSKRAKIIGSLPEDMRRDGKVTPELAKRFPELRPLLVIVDECQEVFGDPDRGKEVGETFGRIIKRGRALGIMLFLATQKPEAAAIPSAVRDNVSIRFALRVMGHVANDMLLGTGSYKDGFTACDLRPADRGVGYLRGVEDLPVVLRSAFIDSDQWQTIARRARARRIASGTLTGHAAGDHREVKRARPILDDIAAIWPGDAANVHLAALAEPLTTLHPDYAHLAGLDPASEDTTAAVRALLESQGHKSEIKQVNNRQNEAKKQQTRAGLKRATIERRHSKTTAAS